MRKKRAFWTKIVVLPFLLLGLIGCGSGKREFLPQLLSPFSCRVTGECGGEAFTATVTAGEWKLGEDGVQERSLQVIYTAPKHLCGLVATLEADGCTLTLDGMKISDAHLDGFLLPARLLGDAFAVTNTLVQKQEGREVCVVVGGSENGSRQVTVDGESGVILFVEGTLHGIYAEFSVEGLEGLEQ